MKGVSDFYSSIEPVTRDSFGLGLKKMKEIYSRIFKKGKEDDYITEHTEHGGTGVLALKKEKALMGIQRVKQGWTKRHTGAVYAGAAEVSWEAVRFSRYKEIKKTFANF